MQAKFKHIIKLLKAYCLRKCVTAEHLYKVVNQNNPEMDMHVFSKVIRHMDKDITDYEIKVLFV